MAPWHWGSVVVTHSWSVTSAVGELYLPSQEMDPFLSQLQPCPSGLRPDSCDCWAPQCPPGVVLSTVTVRPVAAGPPVRDVSWGWSAKSMQEPLPFTNSPGSLGTHRGRLDQHSGGQTLSGSRRLGNQVVGGPGRLPQGDCVGTEAPSREKGCQGLGCRLWLSFHTCPVRRRSCGSVMELCQGAGARLGKPACAEPVEGGTLAGPSPSRSASACRARACPGHACGGGGGRATR